MTSLHRVVDATKKLLVGFVIGIILLLVIVFVVNFFKQLNEKLHPAPPTPPTVAFGKLPPIDFPTPAAPTQNFTYTLNTVSGNLPDLPDKETVYKIVQPQPSLLAFQKVQEIATKN